MSYEARNDNYIRDVSQEVNEAIAFCSMQCHCGGGSQYNVTLRCFDGFHKNEDRNIEYKPTAEWQRIQDELQQGREAVEDAEFFRESLPATKDGVVILWGNTVWFYDDHNQKPVWGVVNSIEDIRESDMEGEFYLTGWLPDEEIPFQSPNIYCFAFKEACLVSIQEQTKGESI